MRRHQSACSRNPRGGRIRLEMNRDRAPFEFVVRRHVHKYSSEAYQQSRYLNHPINVSQVRHGCRSAGAQRARIMSSGSASLRYAAARQWRTRLTILRTLSRSRRCDKVGQLLDLQVLTFRHRVQNRRRLPVAARRRQPHLAPISRAPRSCARAAHLGGTYEIKKEVMTRSLSLGEK